MRKLSVFFSAVVLSLTVLTTQGCVLLAGAAVGAGGYAYATGYLAKNLDAHHEDVHAAAMEGLKDIGAFVVSDSIGALESKIHAESDDGRTIKIHVEALTEQASQIKIRVGTFGNEAESLRILNATTNRL